ncbi:hypothetical protein Hanom_Chr10g00922771 [Helianthus anomalus]
MRRRNVIRPYLFYEKEKRHTLLSFVSLPKRVGRIESQVARTGQLKTAQLR